MSAQRLAFVAFNSRRTPDAQPTLMFDEFWQKGETMKLEDAIEYALSRNT